MAESTYEGRVRALLARMELVSYGTVQRFGSGRGSGHDGGNCPPGESTPLHEEWAAILDGAPPDTEVRQALLAEAEAELEAYVRRQLAPDTVETLDELCDRVVADGWGITADECSRAMRCTPTLVRRARLDAGRHPETGYHLPARSPDALTWARALDGVGLSVRQIEELTGIPKSTLHDRLRRAA